MPSDRINRLRQKLRDWREKSSPTLFTKYRTTDKKPGQEIQANAVKKREAVEASPRPNLKKLLSDMMPRQRKRDLSDPNGKPSNYMMKKIRQSCESENALNDLPELVRNPPQPQMDGSLEMQLSLENDLPYHAPYSSDEMDSPQLPLMLRNVEVCTVGYANLLKVMFCMYMIPFVFHVVFNVNRVTFNRTFINVYR
ncbi:hypothetical protein QAD02_006575 [Eretmocerus hayati]|uniref:Uncharacterized protein n=1 Tax=Eretmocerus hayati TaxID=131215 RepID=A0ACC2N1C6_9HYME|nr:hypothetical protein QAD02_006575 [Eretmocerus hayati]